MLNYESFNCHIEIIRNLPNSITGNDSLYSEYNVFFSKTPTPFISIGSSPKSSVVVDGISPQHYSFNFQFDSMLITANDIIEVTHNDEIISLKNGDIHTISFSVNELVDFYTLLEWTVDIAPYIKLKGTITLEEGVEKNIIEEFLQTNYELCKKISENDRFMIYQVAENKVAKILHPYRNKEIENVNEFVRIADNLQRIDSESICKVEKIDTALLPHVVLEYFQGQTLGNYLAKKGRLRYRETNLVISKIAELLKVTENKKYICKNLSPKNILCAGDKKIKFTGWNICTYSNSLDDNESIFLAPEYFQEEVKITCAVDIYSLGAIFYYLISGKFLFQGIEEYRQYILKGVSISRNDLQVRSIYITPQISILLEAMLAMDPKKRPTPSGILDWIKDIHDNKLWDGVLNMDEEGIYYGLQIVSSIKASPGQICALKDNKTFTIGRTADLNIHGDYRISRQHTQIILKNGICILKDLGSSNGTKINGEKIKEEQIENGTCFLIGETTLCFWDFQKLKKDRMSILAM